MAKKRKKKTGNNLLKKCMLVFAVLFIILLTAAGFVWKKYMLDSVTDTAFWLYIDRNSTIESVLRDLGQNMESSNVARIGRIARINEYSPQSHPGAYRIEPGTGIFDLYRKLSRGAETPIRFTFNNIRTKSDLAQRIGQSFMMTEEEMNDLLNDREVAAEFGFGLPTFTAMFIPDTYEMYWSVSPRRLLEKMHGEYEKFWTEERRAKAEAAGLSLQEVSTLASIVEEETKAPDEMKVVAGLYLNRLKKNMLLQADPTVKFAVNDFTIRRILKEHLETESPYNTYKYAGLPPAPINVPPKACIDAVLNPERHDYIFFCASPAFDGTHRFAVGYAEHSRNAREFQRALTERRKARSAS